ncbi:MAG: type II toxin-antitoxin system ParD family antitoxin [Pseudomonadales bacterium]|nr:type II toxin-antitoxin system ParD family antitoxin [Pseudomonadales bacterium]
MNISLTPQLERYVKQKVDTGMYNSVSEVMREALRLLEERDALKEIKMEALRRDIKAGIDELDRGEGTPLSMDNIKAKARAIKEKRD